MRKVCAAILSAAICLAVSGASAWASEHQSTLSAGYLHARTNAPGSDNLNGINVKYRYEFTDTLGLITSFSYADAEDEQKTHYSDTAWMLSMASTASPCWLKVFHLHMPGPSPCMKILSLAR